jgi:hypothetical protein
MKRPVKRLLQGLAVLIVAPPVIWLGIVFVMPTGWIRDRVVSALQNSTKHEVQLETLRILPFGGVELTSLAIASPASPSNPWLKVANLSADVRLGDLLRGRIKPTACRATGIALRVQRDSAGRLEFDELLRHELKDVGGSKPAGEIATTEEHEVALIFSDAVIEVIDIPSETNLELTEVQGRGTFGKSSAALTELTGKLNGGTVDLVARLDRSMGRALDAQLQVRDVNLGVGTKALAYMIPLLATSETKINAQGNLTLDLSLQGHGESPESLGKSLKGAGHVTVESLSLEDSQILGEVQSVLPISTKGKSGSLRGHFELVDRRVTTGDTVLKIVDFPVSLAGWSDFDGKIDYQIKCEKLDKVVNKLASRLPPEARALLADLPMDELAALTEVKVTGTIDRPKVKSAERALLSKQNGGKDPARRASDKAKLKEAGLKFLDRVIR